MGSTVCNTHRAFPPSGSTTPVHATSIPSGTSSGYRAIPFEISSSHGHATDGSHQHPLIHSHLCTPPATASFGDLEFSKTTALQSLTIHALRGVTVYVRYVRSCLLHTPIQDLCISANMHIHEKAAWADMDETIAQSLTVFPRPNFVLHIVLGFYATRHQSETFV